jgi:molybdenum cofactor biosynthesis enzyme MoaA
MPAERAYPLDEVIEACKAYRAASSRRVTLEYCLIEGFNDTPECAKALQSLIRDTDMLLNLIDVNEGGGLGKNSAACMRNFCKLLKNLNINYTIRRKSAAASMPHAVSCRAGTPKIRITTEAAHESVGKTTGAWSGKTTRKLSESDDEIRTAYHRRRRWARRP